MSPLPHWDIGPQCAIPGGRRPDAWVKAPFTASDAAKGAFTRNRPAHEHATVAYFSDSKSPVPTDLVPTPCT